MSETEPIARDDFFESLLGDFLDESGQLLDRLNENLLQLDQWVGSLDPGQHARCDSQLLNEMFRSAHSLKGLSAMLGLKDINSLTHKVENVFDAARKDELSITPDVVELIFQALDRLVGLVDTLKEPGREPVECESVLEGIRTVLQRAGAERQQTTQADAERALAAPVSEVPPEKLRPPVEPPAPPSAPPEPPAVPCNQTPETAVARAPAPNVVDCFASLQDETELAVKYMPIFIDETDLSIDTLSETLLALEGGGSREAKERLLIISHRIKGSAASVGLNRAAKLAHLMEDLLQDLVDTGRPLSPEVTDALLRSTDALRQYVAGLRSGNTPADHFSDLARELLAAQQTREEPTTPAPAATAPASPAAGTPTGAAAPAAEALTHLRGKVALAAHEEENALVGLVYFQPGLTLAGLKGRLVYEKLANLGEVCHFEPAIETLEELETLDFVGFGLVTEKPADEVRRQLRLGGVQRVLVETLDSRPIAVAVSESPVAASAAAVATPAASPADDEATPAKSAAAAAGRPAEGGARPTETVRVDIERLDQLMNLAGQLVISKARFTQIGDSLRTALAGKQSVHMLNSALAALSRIAAGRGTATSAAELQTELEGARNTARRLQNELEIVRCDVASLAHVRGSINGLFEAIHQLDRVADGIQRNVMETRMVPIGPLFARFKRVIRDIARTNGRVVNLVINGEKTELDKRMIDELGDPLLHMVRNAVDHGIEPPEVRRAAGKPEQGTVTLHAFHRGNSIVIQVCDDGKGLDADRIRRKAVEKGLLTEADAERMSRQQMYQLIWEPGLSTAEKITEVSGRGMGMDIVKSKIEDLHGMVELDSTPGQGTTMTIKLPLTLAILPSLMVEIQGDVYAMPLEAVEEIVHVGRQDLNTVHGQWTATVRGRVISVVRLGELLTWSGATADQRSDVDDATLVIIGEEGRELGLAVDRVLGEEDVVIKSMAENYRNVPGIAGASILGDGRVSLILDVAALIDLSSGKNSPGPSKN